MVCKKKLKDRNHLFKKTPENRKEQDKRKGPKEKTK